MLSIFFAAYVYNGMVMQRRLALLLFLPSALSGTLVFLTALGVLGYGAWTYIYDNQLFYGFFSGAYGIQTYLWNISFDFSVWTSTFLRSPAAYYVLVGGVAIAAGIAVFTVLQLIRSVMQQSSETLHAAHDPTAVHMQYLRDTVGRLWLRVLSMVGWTLYTAFFVSTFLPFIALLTQVGIESIQKAQPGGWLKCVAAGGLLIFSLHLHVVFARLTTLRPRLFGLAATEEAEADSEHNLP
jgi:hypothetical protein